MTGLDKLSVIKDQSINSGSRDLLMFCPNSVIAEEEHVMQYGVHRIDYSGDIIYENIKPVPNRILFDGGYITFSNKQPVYQFYLTDHQGNVRVVASADGTVEETNHYYPFGALFGESAGSNKQRYKYNGKELERLLALDWYDYGARWYDPVLARWHAVDPLAEKYPDVSPYVYCLNNSVNAIDPDGRKIVFVNGYLGFGSPEGGSKYWNGEYSAFVTHAKNVFNDNVSPFFTNYDFEYLKSSNFLRDKSGYNYAKKYYDVLIKGMEKGKDVFNFVSHSMGGAFSEGMMRYLSEQGWRIENALYLNAWEPTKITNKVEKNRIDATCTNDPVQILSVPVLQKSDIPNSDVKIRVSSKESIQYIHRDLIDGEKNIWTEYNWNEIINKIKK